MLFFIPQASSSPAISQFTTMTSSVDKSFLFPLSFAFEKDFDHYPWVDFVNRTWPTIPVLACTIYFLMIVIGTRVMKDRKPFGWKKSLGAWNLLLCVFSLVGTIRTMPLFVYNLTHVPFTDTFCTHGTPNFLTGPSGFWVLAFFLSKLPELIDTVFIVFRKSKLMFLHWYHHITVLLYAWHCYVDQSSTGLYFCAMNYAVHTLMYGYYFLMTIKAVPKWFKPEIITIAQLLQMVVGGYVCFASYYYVRTGTRDCDVSRENALAGALMYSSYFCLFADFFVKRFILKTNGKKGGASSLKKAQ